MILLSGSGIKKMFLDETLFEDVSFNIDSADKIGFIGVNGAGKSTLFKLLTGELEYDSGDIYRNKFTRIGYLDQYACSDSGRTIMEELMTSFGEVIEIERQLDEIRFDIERGAGALEELVERQTALQERYSELDGYYYKSRIKSALTGLGFSEEEFKLSVNKLSGGQKTRVSLGKVLLSDANLLLLDEPTNHLDIGSVEWLESFLQSYKGAFIVISHDRYFLDRVTNKTFEMENGRFHSFDGSYSAYMEQREIERKTEERRFENTMREIRRLEEVVEQQRRWNREKNIKTAQSKQKVIDRLEKTLVKPSSEEDIRFSFKALAGGGQEVLVCKELGMSFDGAPLFCKAELFIRKGERVFLLGPNGCGKTTLLKIIMGIYKQTAGECRIGANIQIGYYDQLQENLDMNKTVIDEVWDAYPKKNQTEIRNALAVFLFRGEDVFKEIYKLSGGERARVELVKLMLKSVNFLVMDEPTNHLDIESREALENALRDYDGTMLVVSHDRYFINKLADRVLYMEPDSIKSYIGSYDDYLEAKSKEDNAQAEIKADKPKNLSYLEQKKLQSDKRKTLNRLNKLEEKIAEAESELESLNADMLRPEYASDFERLAELSAMSERKNSQLQGLMEEWEDIQTEIEEKGYDQ